MSWTTYSGNLVGGSGKKYSNLTSSGFSHEQFAETYCRAGIVEFYLVPNNAYSGVGFNRSNCNNLSYYNNTSISSSQYWRDDDGTFTSPYCFNTREDQAKIIACTDGDQEGIIPIRRVFAIHDYPGSTVSAYGVYYLTHLFKNPVTKSGGSTEAYFGYSVASYDTWVSHTDGDGHQYFTITSKSNNKFVGKSVSVVGGRTYTIKMHTFSQANCDGIIISNTTLTSSASVTSSGITRCSGVDANNTYTYTPSSNGYLYIYFKTDSANLGDTRTVGGYWDITYDTWGGEIHKEWIPESTEYVGVTYGDVEIIESVPSVTVTLNRNGGSGGTSSVTGTYGSVLPSITIPSRTGFNFVGYYNTTSVSGGTRYISPNGTGSTTWTGTSNTTLYARWTPTYTYDCGSTPFIEDSDINIYATTKPKVCSATDVVKTVAISTNGLSTLSGVTFTISLEVHNASTGNAVSGWSISSDGRYFTIPQNTSSGRYYVDVYVICSAGSNYTSRSDHPGEFEVNITSVSLLSNVALLRTREGSSLTLKVGESADIYFGIKYNNGANVDVAYSSSTSYSRSNTKIEVLDNNISPTGLRMYVDHFDSDFEGTTSQTYLRNWLLDYRDSDMYEYTGQTISIGGSTYYLWKHASPYTFDSYVSYVITSTITLSNLQSYSLKNSLSNISTHPIVSKLYPDKLVYDSGATLCIIEAWQE